MSEKKKVGRPRIHDDPLHEYWRKGSAKYYKKKKKEKKNGTEVEV